MPRSFYLFKAKHCLALFLQQNIMSPIFNHINQYYSLSNEAKEALQHCFEKHIFPKNKLLLKEGQICRHLYFLESGAVRGYYNLDGKEVTHWFGFENDFFTSFYSFTTENASVENIELLEGSIIWSISKESLHQLFNHFQEIERVVRIAYEKYYVRLEERFVNNQFKTAKELYENLLKQHSHILERVPLGYVASYLGITQETLSRIRSQL